MVGIRPERLHPKAGQVLLGALRGYSTPPWRGTDETAVTVSERWEGGTSLRDGRVAAN